MKSPKWILAFLKRNKRTSNPITNSPEKQDNEVTSIEVQPQAQCPTADNPNTQATSIETQPSFPTDQYHVVLGTAEVLRRAGLIPHVKVASQKEWEAAAEGEKERRLKYGRSVIKITEEFGRGLYQHLIVPYQPDRLCVITAGMGLNFCAMTAENYYSRYWK